MVRTSAIALGCAIRRLLQRVGARWRASRVLQAVVRTSVVIFIVLGLAIVATRWNERSPAVLALVGVALVVFSSAALIWAVAPLRRVPDAADDGAVASRPLPPASAAFEPVADAPRGGEGADASDPMSADGLRQGWFRAFVVAAVLAVLAFFSTGPARQVFDAAVLTLFPSRITLQVAPGNVRIRSGAPLGINARLVGTRGRGGAQVEIGDGERWRTVDMRQDEDGRFRLRIDSVTMPFKYRVLAGSVTSPTYSVGVAHAPRVTRIDVDYTYPARAGLMPRTDEDSGDLYAPAGTVVQLHVHADLPVTLAVVSLDNGQRTALAADGDDTFGGSLTLAANGSYRVALAGADGLINSGDTEYFIRLTDNPPPVVRLLKPAADRVVTPIDEVEIEARAEGHRGIDHVELVYAARGEAEQVVPLAIPKHAFRVIAKGVLRLEPLNLQPGDLVSCFVRARQADGAVARSDIYLLEIGTPSHSLRRAPAPALGASPTVADDLIAAQKEIVAATWKIGRRLDNGTGALPEQDIRSLSGRESDVKARVEQASSTPENAKMRVAAASLEDAVMSLGSLSTAAALSHEMEALRQLLKARADVGRSDPSIPPPGKDRP